MESWKPLWEDSSALEDGDGEDALHDVWSAYAFEPIGK